MREAEPTQTTAQRLEAAHRLLEALTDLAYERFVQESNFDFRDYLDEAELARYDAAEQVIEDADRTVVIEVLGGVAYVASQPEHIEVTIFDHDNEADQSALDRFLENADLPQE